MDYDKKDFGRFGTTFQEKLVQLILEDRPFSEQIEEVIELDFFEKKYLKIFTKLIFNYREEYGIHPSKETVQTLLKTKLEDESPVDKKLVQDFFARTEKREKIKEVDFVKDTALEFCKKQKMKIAFLKGAQELNKETVEYDKVRNFIVESLNLGADNDYGHDFLKDFEMRYEENPRFPVSTGWEIIDDIMQGGHGRGELGVIIAPTGSGKSMAMTHFGAQALIQGKNVVHYTLELSEEVVGQRYDSCISGVHLNNLKKKKDEVYEKIKDVEGGLTIKYYPPKSATVNTFRKHLDKLKRKGTEIDMIIVDYGDLVRPTKTRNAKHMELEEIYEELRALASEMECPLWTASQTNRSGLNTDVVTMEAISEAFSKCFVADFIMSLSRTVDDKPVNGGRVYVAKNRNGGDGFVYPIFMDTGYVAIDVLEAQGNTTEEIVANSKVRQEKLKKQKMQDVYKKYKLKADN